MPEVPIVAGSKELLGLVEVSVAALGLLVHAECHDVHQPVRGGTGRVSVHNVGEGDRHLLVAVIEQLGDDQSVEQVPGVDHVVGHLTHEVTQAERRPGGIAEQATNIPSVHDVLLTNSLLCNLKQKSKGDGKRRKHV